MAYASTKIIWDDKSDINPLEAPAEDTLDRPICMAGFSADKGPEEFQNGLMGEKFFKLYGYTPSFVKHGQTLIQSAKVINAGGKLFCKRIVAEDATLANIGVVAKVSKLLVQKEDENGNLLYTTDGTDETVDPIGTTPVMIQRCQVSYELKTVSIAGNHLPSFGSAFLADNGHTKAIGEDDQYALFLLADNGRGVSNKKFRLYPDTTASRPVNYVKYILNVIEDGNVSESMAFTLNPDIIESDNNISLQNVIARKSFQMRSRIFESEINAFIENVAYISGIDLEEISYSDILFGNDLYGEAYEQIVVDNTVQLDNINGIRLMGGDNGLFGDAPINASTYASELVKVFNGDASDDIYDLDNCRIDAVLDANYPALVKRAIENLAIFREDLVYFRDMGLGLNSLALINNANTSNYKSRFCATYHNSWDVKDPYTKKDITVTLPYSFSSLFVKHFLNGRSRPICGQLYSIVFADVVEGTVNFIPKNTPAVDQKQFFEDTKINYVAYYSGVLTLESEYTSQPKLTQLSWIHNVMMTQELIKEIRLKCPKIRYNFITGSDLETYKNDINKIIESYKSKFNTIELVYTKDSNYEANKIFYAVINVTFKDFVQTEIFKITALKNS